MKDRDLKAELQTISGIDVATLLEKAEYYGDSWAKRGGIGAFMVIARKWDRIENMAKEASYDVFNCRGDVREEIADLRRYLLLLENELLYIEGPGPAYVNQD